LAASGDAPHVDVYDVSADYLRAMKIPLIRGRLIEERDKRGVAPVALVSESCARRQFAGQDPIGQQIQTDGDDEHEPWATIVGVVGDVHQYGLDKKPDAAVYLAFAQMKNPQDWASLVVRSTPPSDQIEAAVRREMRNVDPSVPIFHLQPMDAYIAKSLAQRTFTMWLVGVFGVLALMLATVGIYSVVSYAVSIRTREVGIRMALGAESHRVMAMILRQVGLTVICGVGLGLVIALLLNRLIVSLLFEVQPTDMATFAAVAGLITIVALAASYVPVQRAVQLDPMKALRQLD